MNFRKTGGWDMPSVWHIFQFQFIQFHGQNTVTWSFQTPNLWLNKTLRGFCTAIRQHSSPVTLTCDATSAATSHSTFFLYLSYTENAVTAGAVPEVPHRSPRNGIILTLPCHCCFFPCPTIHPERKQTLRQWFYGLQIPGYIRTLLFVLW